MNSSFAQLRQMQSTWELTVLPADRYSSGEEQPESAPAPPTGGHDPELFVDKDKIGEYICQICHEIARDCVEVSCGNGHIFCNDCIRYHFQINGRTCPADLARNIKLAPNDFVRRKILSSDVRCKRHPFGCDWVGALRQLESHVESCSFEPIRCKYCKMEVSSKLMDQHLEQCDEYLVRCSWCNNMYRRKILNEHTMSCYCKPTQCPNGCNAEIPSNTMKNHLDNDCPERMVECPMQCYGCNVKIKWKEISGHLESQKINHLELQMTWMLQQNAQKTEQISILQSRVVQLEAPQVINVDGSCMDGMNGIYRKEIIPSIQRSGMISRQSSAESDGNIRIIPSLNMNNHSESNLNLPSMRPSYIKCDDLNPDGDRWILQYRQNTGDWIFESR